MEGSFIFVEGIQNITQDTPIFRLEVIHFRHNIFLTIV